MGKITIEKYFEGSDRPDLNVILDDRSEFYATSAENLRGIWAGFVLDSYGVSFGEAELRILVNKPMASGEPTRSVSILMEGGRWRVEEIDPDKLPEERQEYMRKVFDDLKARGVQFEKVDIGDRSEVRGIRIPGVIGRSRVDILDLSIAGVDDDTLEIDMVDQRRSEVSYRIRYRK